MPDACTLPTAERPARDGELDSVLAAVKDARRTDFRTLRLSLDPSPEAAAQAARLAAKETACCAFFTFTLTADGAGLRLEIAVPDNQTHVLDALAGRIAM